jgi:phosphate transport system substrate-binding protein
MLTHARTDTARRRTRGLVAVVALLLVAAASVTACGDDGSTAQDVGASGSLSGSGATFPKVYYEESIIDFEDANPHATVTYAGGGSGKGRTDLQEQLVDFAGSDGLVKPADYGKFAGGEFLYIPTITAPITVAYNLKGVDGLRLTPEVVAKIFQRRITRWDDPEITADNPDAELSGDIFVVRRSDGSGTTENFTKFLDKAVGKGAGDVWTLGSGSTVEWPGDTLAGEGNGGVARVVKDTRGAIGYVDYSDAKATGLRFASVRNKAGRFVAPTLESATAAAATATVNPDLSYDPLWADGDDAYPIAAPTWILVYKQQHDAAKAELLKAYLRFLLTGAQDFATEIDYSPLPADLRDKALAQLDQIVVPTT